jgi:hypothetical protein
MNTDLGKPRPLTLLIENVAKNLSTQKSTLL